ncbi:MAG: HNH endonuclease [Chloroflexota bacterium]
MIHIPRLPEPAIFKEKKARWEKNKSNRLKGDDRKAVLKILRAMSKKCFYCEKQISCSESDIEHYIEIAERPDLAFEWTNLYLSCKACNNKLPNTDIPVIECVDPCGAEHDPTVHLTFDEEIIKPKRGSERGRKTIQKYDLNRQLLLYDRLKKFKMFDKALRTLITEKRFQLTEKEKEKINFMREPEHEYSLMFRVFLEDWEYILS